MFTSQSGNYAAGDVVGGSQVKTVHIHASPSPLAKLYDRFRTSTADSPYAAQIAEQLQHYCNVATDGDVRGLEEKLKASNREDQLRKASLFKERAAKLIMRWQTSGIAQDIITIVLSTIYSNFLLEVTPAIEAGKSREEVDSIINEKVITPVLHLLGDNDLGITTVDLLGMLYFLGGNCHVRWDKC